ncbi:MAG: MarR family transcriptional regulator [Ilumatobacteraceae bacterium]|jgi:DNA-binding MarR family transcriptional regulator|nr:MarR family transcriptional regulator [Ilumatobacteraceae bacterium]
MGSIRTPVDVDSQEHLELIARVGLSWRELRRAATTTLMREHIFGTGDGALEPGQMDTLDLLVQQPSWRMGDLAEKLRVDPSTATRAVQRLVNMGLAERLSGKDDGRVVQVAVTDDGRKRHNLVSSRRLELMKVIFKNFTEEERVDLAHLLEKLVASIDSALKEVST